MRKYGGLGEKVTLHFCGAGPHDHRAALRTDLEHILHLLVPLVAYYGGIALSQQLNRDVDRAGARFEVRKWLQLHLHGMEYGPERLIEACEQAANRTELRRELELNYERFNRVLLRLGEPTLSNEAELRQLYDAYLAWMRSSVIERLRRHFVSDFRNGNDLAGYVERKSLSFLAFNEEWVLEREALEMDLVESHVSALLAEALGEDVSVKLPSLNRLVEANRKVVREMTQATQCLLRGFKRSPQTGSQTTRLGSNEVASKPGWSSSKTRSSPVAGRVSAAKVAARASEIGS